MNIPGIMIAAPGSGSGKTSVSCALMEAFRSRKMDVRACKCGPDYIDPMFHREVLGVDSRNLDLFFSGEEGIKEEYTRHGAGADIVVTEGVMGFYDGIALDTDRGSSYDVARVLGLPVILVIPCRGAALSIAAFIRGMTDFRPDADVRGVILNRVSKMLYPRLKEMLERELSKMGCDISILGYIPEDDAFCLESRHLGLVTPAELKDIRTKTKRAGEIVSECVELDRILSVAKEAARGQAAAVPDMAGADNDGKDDMNGGCKAASSSEKEKMKKRTDRPVRIAMAQDEAFCFYYRANLELLEEMGCELVPFSPLKDESLPEGVRGLLLGGGYPELYAGRLCANRRLLKEIRECLGEDMPCIAECGGFMYLHERMQDKEGRTYPMAGVIRGTAYPTGRLVRFGYVDVTANERMASADMGTPDDGSYLLPGESIRAHEFHYWDSTDSGGDCTAVKPGGMRKWECIHMRGNLFAGYPHLYLPSNREFARRYVCRCRAWDKAHGNKLIPVQTEQEKDRWQEHGGAF